mgnify:CR=1 FL=1
MSDIKFLEANGVDCVGMSTVHEAVVAGYCGMKVLAFSIVTDVVSLEFDTIETSDHNEIIKVAAKKAVDSERMITRFLEIVSKNPALLD